MFIFTSLYLDKKSNVKKSVNIKLMIFTRFFNSMSSIFFFLKLNKNFPIKNLKVVFFKKSCFDEHKTKFKMASRTVFKI